MKAQNKVIEPIILEAARKLKGEAFKVFMAWIVDADSYSATPSVLASRLGMKEPNVRRALRALVKEGFLAEDGEKQFINSNGKSCRFSMYKLSTVSPRTFTVSPVIVKEGASVSPRSSIPPNKKPTNLPTSTANEVRGQDKVKELSNIEISQILKEMELL